MRLLLLLVLSMFTSTLLADDFPSDEELVKKFKPVLNVFKKAIEGRDLKALSSIISYPLNISTKEQDKSVAHFKYKTIKVKNETELKDYKHILFSETFSELASCVNENNITNALYKGFSAASGGLWFFWIYGEDGNDFFVLSSISVPSESTTKWINQHCGSGT